MLHMSAEKNPFRQTLFQSSLEISYLLSCISLNNYNNGIHVVTDIVLNKSMNHLPWGTYTCFVWQLHNSQGIQWGAVPTRALSAGRPHSATESPPPAHFHFFLLSWRWSRYPLLPRFRPPGWQHLLTTDKGVQEKEGKTKGGKNTSRCMKLEVYANVSVTIWIWIRTKMMPLKRNIMALRNPLHPIFLFTAAEVYK